MRKILSAESMKKISKATIKKLVNNSGGVMISDSAAAAIANLLEKKATRIAKYAVKRAKAKKRESVIAEDIESYRVRFGD
jgi:histone H3/H4